MTSAFSGDKLASAGHRASCESGADCESGECNTNGECVSKPCFKDRDCESNSCDYITPMPGNCTPTPHEHAESLWWAEGNGYLVEHFAAKAAYFMGRPYEGVPNGTDGPGTICMKFGVCPHAGVLSCPHEGKWYLESKSLCHSYSGVDSRESFQVRCCSHFDDVSKGVKGGESLLETAEALNSFAQSTKLGLTSGLRSKHKSRKESARSNKFRPNLNPSEAYDDNGEIKREMEDGCNVSEANILCKRLQMEGMLCVSNGEIVRTTSREMTEAQLGKQRGRKQSSKGSTGPKFASIANL